MDLSADMSDNEYERLQQEHFEQERFEQAKTLNSHPEFVKEVNDEDLRKLKESLWDEGLTREQQEHTILYMLKLMVEADVNAADAITYAAEASLDGGRQYQSSFEAAGKYTTAEQMCFDLIS